MNTGKLLAFGAAGVAAWWFFFRTPSSAGTAPAVAASGSSATVAAGSLDAAYQRMVQKSNGAKSGSVDDWESWFMQGTPAISLPDPMPIFQAAMSGFDRSKQLTASEYWGVMAPVLKSSFGLAGLGLYGTLFAGGRW